MMSRLAAWKASRSPAWPCCSTRRRGQLVGDDVQEELGQQQPGGIPEAAAAVDVQLDRRGAGVDDDLALRGAVDGTVRAVVQIAEVVAGEEVDAVVPARPVDLAVRRRLRAVAGLAMAWCGGWSALRWEACSAMTISHQRPVGAGPDGDLAPLAAAVPRHGPLDPPGVLRARRPGRELGAGSIRMEPGSSSSKVSCPPSGSWSGSSSRATWNGCPGGR